MLALGLSGRAGVPRRGRTRREASRSLFALLVLAGAVGASVNSASGRAVMHWFAPSERGLALGIRQTAIPLGGLIVALVLPAAGGERRLATLRSSSSPGSARARRGRRARRSSAVATATARARARVGRSARCATRRLWRLSVSERSLPLRAGRGHRVRRPLPPRRARALRRGRGARDRGRRRCSRSGSGSVRAAGRTSSARGSARCACSGSRRGGAGAHRSPRGRASVGARARSRSRGRPLDGLERALVHGGGRARRRSAERSGDRLSAVGALRPRVSRRSSSPPRVGTGRGRSRSGSLRCCPLSAGACCGPLRGLLGSAHARSRAARRAVRDRRRPRREPAASRPPAEDEAHRARGEAGSRRRGSRSRSTATATSSDMPGAEVADVWVGSHLDSVPQGGRFDGALGVVAAIEAVERVGAGSVVVFRGEEVGCVGSRARVAAGGALPRAFLELHVEQGPVLAERDAPVGVVTGIVGYARGELVLDGRAGHAGTTPMVGREDALVAAAARSNACVMRRSEIAGAVATVGKLDVEPGGANVIPSRVRLSLDVRAPDVETARRARRLDRFRPDLPRRACAVLRAHAPKALRDAVAARGLPLVELALGCRARRGNPCDRRCRRCDALRAQPQRRRQPLARRALVR